MLAQSTPSTFQVSETGAAVYEVPIKVPPGTAGMEPRLSLAYNSQHGNGLLGMGWSLSGLSTITRCPRTLAQDGVRGGVNFDSNDRFCMDGMRLVAVSGSYGANGTEYRTERESFSRIVSYGQVTGPGSGPQWFKVWTKSGQILEYGNDSPDYNSRIEVQSTVTDTVRLWALNKVTDTSGNYFTISYIEDRTNGDFRPDRIDYTGTSSTAAIASVRFTYEARSDIAPAYITGSKVEIRNRLINVKTYSSATQLVRDYRLQYGSSPLTARSMLGSIWE